MSFLEKLHPKALVRDDQTWTRCCMAKAAEWSGRKWTVKNGFAKIVGVRVAALSATACAAVGTAGTLLDGVGETLSCLGRLKPLTAILALISGVGRTLQSLALTVSLAAYTILGIIVGGYALGGLKPNAPVETVRERLHRLESEGRELTAEVARLTDELAVTSRTLNNSTRRVTRLEERNRELQERCDDLESRLDVMRDTALALAEELEGIPADDFFNDGVAGLRERFAQLNGAVDNARSENSNLVNDLLAQHTATTRLRNAKERVEQQLQEAIKELEGYTDEDGNRHTGLREQLIDYQDLKKQNEELTQDIEAIEI